MSGTTDGDAVIGGESTSPPIYLRPLGLLSGRAAADAVACGALPLGAGGSAFTHIELYWRSAGRVERWRGAVPDLSDFAHSLGPDVARAVELRLAKLRALPAGVPGVAGRAPLLMGVVNVTPDSFSDGGLCLATEDAIAHGRRLRAEGADIVDVGGESTRPGADPVPAELELERVLPVIRALVADGVPVSIDTRKADVMGAAVAAGACMINDVSALAHDPRAPAAAADCGCPVVLMHSLGDPRTMQADPCYEHAPLDVFDSLEARIEAALAAGIAWDRILVDPGIGFGKTMAHNHQILAFLSLYLGLGVPVVLGVSRKSFIARTAGDVPPAERVPGSIAAGLAGIAQGVAMLRVHDVAATRQALAVWQAIALGDTRLHA